MPRPRKCRRVCGVPGLQVFGPLVRNHDRCHVDDEAVIMAVDEFEAIRLIDFEGLNQEECAGRMDVARTTVQRIYDEARRKLAVCLVKGCVLRIEGGDYSIYGEPAACSCPGPRCRCGHREPLSRS